jgi:outer membrane protein OmpA-like peptidoglycan-associated protein
VTLFAGLGLIGVMMASRPIQAAGQAEPLLRPTPLVLKDGRIASVSIHDVPFARGRVELTAEAGADLTELARAVGTDCFLTAQVIGHVDSDEIDQQDSLSAHRLARSRADAVQASLIHGGLPEKAIASIWDWQFMVREARTTLWIFQLTAGEDCEGRPLREDMMARAPPSAGQQATPEGRQALVPAVTPIEPAPEQRVAEPVSVPLASAAEPGRNTAEAPPQLTTSATVPAEPIPQQEISRTRRPQRSAESSSRAIVSAAAAAERPAKARVDAREPARQPTPVPPHAEETPPRRGTPNVTLPMPPIAAETAAATAPAKRSVAAAARATETKPTRAYEPAAMGRRMETGSEGRLVIKFATNSTYFLPGTANRLQQLLAKLETGRRYEVSLQVAMSATTRVVGANSAQEAARYNKWVAERRLERLQQWLFENAGPDLLSIRPEYRANDESHRVIVRLLPAG